MLLAATLSPGRAWADVATEAVRIVYEAPGTCPDETAFVAEVRARTGRARIVGAAEEGRVFIIKITPDGDRVVGRLDVVVGPDGVTTARRVTAKACQDVASALALIVAVAIDPDALMTLPPPPPPAPLPAPAPLAPPKPAGPASLPSVLVPAPAKWIWGAGAGAIMATAVGPGPSFGGRVSGEVARGLEGGWAPDARLSLLYLRSPDLPASRGTASLTLLAAELDLCPARAPIGARLALRPCLTFEAGAELGASRGIANPRSAAAPWLGAGALARLQWALSPRFALELEGAALALLTRPSFHLDEPATVLQRAPAWQLSGGASVQYHFL